MASVNGALYLCPQSGLSRVMVGVSILVLTVACGAGDVGREMKGFLKL